MTDLIARARAFAIERHAGQRYGDAPYSVHLEAVYQILVDVAASEELRAAAWLHDVLEDRVAMLPELPQFGSMVAVMVLMVTGRGRNRRERNRLIYWKLKNFPAAVDLKLADRIANVEAGGRQVRMYLLERGEFVEALAGMGSPVLWERLERAYEMAEGR